MVGLWSSLPLRARCRDLELGSPWATAIPAQVVYGWAIPFAVATLLLALLLREAPLRTTANVGRGEEETTP